MVAAEGQELNLQREEGTGAREPLPGTWTLLSAPNKSKFLVQTSSCSALTSPFIPTAGLRLLTLSQQHCLELSSPPRRTMGKHWRPFPKGDVNPKSPLAVQMGAGCDPTTGLTSEHKETPELHHAASCSNAFAAPQLLMHQPPALLSQLPRSWQETTNTFLGTI